MAHLNEQLQQEKSHKERDLKETRESHHSQITDLQEKISSLVEFDLVPSLDHLMNWVKNSM